MFGKKLDTRQKILSLKEILQRAGDARVMWVRGCFDPLLAAHARRIAELRTPGASVAVLLCDPPNPLLAARARAELVAGLAAVDYVAVDGVAPEGAAVIDLNDPPLRESFMEHVRKRHSSAHNGVKA